MRAQKFRIRICRHGHSPHEGDEVTRGLDGLGVSQIKKTASKFPKGVRPILALTSLKARAQQSMAILLDETGNGDLKNDVIALHGMDYSWPLEDARNMNLILGPEHDNVTTVRQIEQMFPDLYPRIRCMLMGSLMTAIQMRNPQPTDDGSLPEIWMTSHSPFGELVTPDPDMTTRRPNGGGITFILELPENGTATSHSLEQF